jgi:glycosyltransferase involved in cell wall biosynthesis
VSRIVRVVDDKLPERDEPFRQRLLECQERIRARADALILNNRENEERWQRLYGEEPPVVLVPTGCPAAIPPARANPYPGNERVMLFLGSLAASRIVRMLNEASRALEGVCRVHLVGRNKSRLYGCDRECRLTDLIVDHGELAQDKVWDYIRYADIGIALATGPHAFDNDVSKILSYLRGGLPVLSEEPIINNRLIHRTEFGTTFPYGDVDELVHRAVTLLATPPLSKREMVMQFMARENSWEKRVETYVTLFRKLLNGRW